VVLLITLARARTVGRVGSHGDPEQQRGEELISEVDPVLKGGDGGAGELHGITADGECGGGPVEKKSRKRIMAVRADISSRRELLVMLWD
jgi:hypothetical protein